MKLQGTRVLVIGGSSGVGLAVAQAAIEEGAKVTIASTDVDRLAAAGQRLGGGVKTVRIDVTDEESVRTYFDSASPLNHIVFTSGDWGGPRGISVSDMDLAAAETLFRVRFWGAVSVAKHSARRLATGGSLTFTDGMIAHRPRKSSAISTAMAGAVEHLTRGLAVELAPIRVNAVCLGAVRTENWDKLPESLREGELARIERHLIPHIGEPADVAQAYLYLMKGGYTTGQVLFAEGGSALS